MPEFCSSHSSPPPTMQAAHLLTLSLACQRYEVGEGRLYTGSAACHFIVLGRVFFSYQSFSFSPPLTSLIQPRLPLLSRSLSWLHVQQGEKERKRVGGQRSLSLRSPVCLLSLQYCYYLPACLAISSQCTFCVAVSFSTREGPSVSVCFLSVFSSFSHHLAR